mgnify:FL=1|tara:strand:+ start:22 stop:507 length:486 start_codon:yes stop_codon:yes gene_type:complete
MAAQIPTNGLNVDAGLDIAGGNLTFTTADKGVHLGVTSATAANLMDDYEEGTWTPSNSNVTLSVTSANYRKVGNLCHVQAYVTFPSNSNSSGATINGLPFTAGGSFAYLTARAGGEGSSAVIVQVNSSSTYGDLYKNNDTGVTNADLSTNHFLFSGTYSTA